MSSSSFPRTESELSRLSTVQLVECLQTRESYIGDLESGRFVARRQAEEAALQLQIDTIDREIFSLAALVRDLKYLHSLPLEYGPSFSNREVNAVISVLPERVLSLASLSPSSHVVIQALSEAVTKAREQQTLAETDAEAWLFTPEGASGQRLVARCKQLLDANTNLGEQLCKENVSRLVAEYTDKKRYQDELLANRQELLDFARQLDEQLEASQATVMVLQHKLSLRGRRDAQL